MMADRFIVGVRFIEEESVGILSVSKQVKTKTSRVHRGVSGAAGVLFHHLEAF